MALSPALQKLVNQGSNRYSRGEESDDANDFDCAPPVKIKLEIELRPGETRRITIKAE